MLSALKHRIIGAIFLLSLSVIFIPIFFDGEAPYWLTTYYSSIPSAPQFPELEKQIIMSEKSLTVTPQSSKFSWLKFGSQKNTESLAQMNQECWSIRVATFVKREEALALEQKLQQNGFPAYLREIPHTRLIGVFVGPELLKENAQTMLENIKTQLGVEGSLVSFDPVA